MKITMDEIVRLANGEPPSNINKDWDFETIIVALADYVLSNSVKETK